MKLKLNKLQLLYQLIKRLLQKPILKQGIMTRLIFKLLVILSLNFLVLNITSAQSSTRKVLFPFSLQADPMERLLLVNFEKDPDSVYIGFEPQVFDDEINGKGHLVIGWRRDKKIDVYHESSLNLDTSKFSIAGAGLNKIISVKMEKAFYEITGNGVQANYKFRDVLGRDIDIVINEESAKKREPFGLLAPMGDAATNPKALPLIFLHDFYFVRKAHTKILISIDNKIHKPDILPIRIDGQKMTFVRYSPEPLIATLNRQHYGTLEYLEPSVGEVKYEKGDCLYELVWNENNVLIKSVSLRNKIHTLKIDFDPAFPCINSMPLNSRQTGGFIISGHKSIGTVSGEFSVCRDNETVKVYFVPSDGWKPNASKLSTKFLFRVAKVFKKWPTTYLWDAELKLNGDNLWHMNSRWTRTGKIIN